MGEGLGGDLLDAAVQIPAGLQIAMFRGFMELFSPKNYRSYLSSPLPFMGDVCAHISRSLPEIHVHNQI